jgi:hypothetical protein
LTHLGNAFVGLALGVSEQLALELIEMRSRARKFQPNVVESGHHTLLPSNRGRTGVAIDA